MKSLWVTLLMGILLLSVVTGASAATMEELGKQVQQLQDALKQALDRIQKLESEKAAAPAAPTAPAAPAAQPAAAPAKTHWYDKVSIGGYWHARYEDRRNAVSAFPPGTWPQTPSEARDEFLIRRLYLNITANVNDRATAVVMLRRLGATTQFIDMEAAFVNYKLDDQWALEFGRVYNKFGWDVWESSSRRLPFDRFAGVEGYGPGGVRGLYFMGPTDHGIYVSHKPAADGSVWEPTVYLGLVNGNFLNAENNDDKTWSVDLKWRKNNWHWGASHINGEYTEGTPAVTTDRRMTGLYVHTDPKPWGIQAEYVNGELFGADVEGWYGQLAYALDCGTPFVRYEQFDPTEGLTGDFFDAWRVGYAWQVDKNNEITFEYMNAHRGEVPVGQWGVQWQLGF